MQTRQTIAGVGVKQNYEQAQNNLSALYEDGHGLRQSLSDTKKLYGKAYDHGQEYGCEIMPALNKQDVQSSPSEALIENIEAKSLPLMT